MPWPGEKYGEEGFGPYPGLPGGFMLVPKDPGAPGLKAVGGRKGRPPGEWPPPGVFGPVVLMSKATGNAGCPGSEGE